MLTPTYAGSEPISGVWALDDGFELRFYTSTALLGLAFSAGYAMPSKVDMQRAASLQWFGADGYCDASVFIGTPPADNLPSDLTDPAASAAYQGFLRGEQTDWLERARKASLLKIEHRRGIVSDINAFRAANLRPVT